MIDLNILKVSWVDYNRFGALSQLDSSWSIDFICCPEVCAISEAQYNTLTCRN